MVSAASPGCLFGKGFRSGFEGASHLDTVTEHWTLYNKKTHSKRHSWTSNMLLDKSWSARCAYRNYLHHLQGHMQALWSMPNAGTPLAAHINCNSSQIFLDFPSFIWTRATKTGENWAATTALSRKSNEGPHRPLIPRSPAESGRDSWSCDLHLHEEDHGWIIPPQGISTPNFQTPERSEKASPAPLKSCTPSPPLPSRIPVALARRDTTRCLERHRRLGLVQLQLRAIVWMCWKPNSHASIWVCRWGYF